MPPKKGGFGGQVLPDLDSQLDKALDYPETGMEGDITAPQIITSAPLPPAQAMKVPPATDAEMEKFHQRIDANGWSSLTPVEQRAYLNREREDWKEKNKDVKPPTKQELLMKYKEKKDTIIKQYKELLGNDCPIDLEQDLTQSKTVVEKVGSTPSAHVYVVQGDLDGRLYLRIKERKAPPMGGMPTGGDDPPPSPPDPYEEKWGDHDIEGEDPDPQQLQQKEKDKDWQVDGGGEGGESGGEGKGDGKGGGGGGEGEDLGEGPFDSLDLARQAAIDKMG